MDEIVERLRSNVKFLTWFSQDMNAAIKEATANVANETIWKIGSDDTLERNMHKLNIKDIEEYISILTELKDLVLRKD